tara:strand:- start:530 stop:709 length:180 start_codon:yes stop_codon:yes gene_type:complete
MFDSVEAPTGEVDKWGFTIKPPVCDNEVIIRCLKNAPCGIDRKQAERIIKEIEYGRKIT